MPEDITSSLMQGMEAGLSIQDVLLSQMDTSNPAMALLTRMIAERSVDSASRSEIEPDEDEEVENELSQARLKRLSAAYRQLQHEAERLRNEVEELQLRNDTVAAALGACYLCWGEYPMCEVCNGNGVAGYFPVHVQPFNELILPAIRSFKRHKIPSVPAREVECEPVRST